MISVHSLGTEEDLTKYVCQGKVSGRFKIIDLGNPTEDLRKISNYSLGKVNGDCLKIFNHSLGRLKPILGKI